MQPRLPQVEAALGGFYPWTATTLLVAGFVVGAAASGRIDEERVLKLLERLFDKPTPAPPNHDYAVSPA